MSLLVKVGALLVIFFVPTKFAIDLQLLGGVWMVQIFPALIFGLFTRWFSGPALLVGWAVGMIVGTAVLVGSPVEAVAIVRPLAWTIPLPWRELDLGLGFAAYNGLTAVLLNIATAAAISLLAPTRGRDETSAADYDDRGL